MLLTCSMGFMVMLSGVSSHAISISPAAFDISTAASERLWLALGNESLRYVTWLLIFSSRKIKMPIFLRRLPIFNPDHLNVVFIFKPDPDDAEDEQEGHQGHAHHSNDGHKVACQRKELLCTWTSCRKEKSTINSALAQMTPYIRDQSICTGTFLNLNNNNSVT